jgi:hypothetical protein
LVSLSKSLHTLARKRESHQNLYFMSENLDTISWANDKYILSPFQNTLPRLDS